MNPSKLLTALGVALLLLPASAMGQRDVGPPRIDYVCPAGGRQGTTFDVEIGSIATGRPVAVHVSGSGMQAVVKSAGDQSKEDRSELERLSKQTQDAATAQEVAEIKVRIAAAEGQKQKAARDGKKFFAAIVQVTVAPDAPIGWRELRVETTGGLSGPYPFHVGNLPEYCKAEVRSLDLSGAKADGIGLPPNSRWLPINDSVRKGLAPPSRSTPPAMINGQLFAGQADRFRFAARKGQQLVMAAAARELIRFIADGSPGWFHATMALYDAAGTEVATSDSRRFQQDPLLLYKVPADGEYAVEIRDTLYRGRSDFIYRLSISEQPFITAMFPLGGRAGEKTAVRLDGCNLPTSQLTYDATGKGPGIEYVAVTSKDGLSHSRPFALDDLPECLEQETNNTPVTAQAIKLPIIVNGRIDPPGERDWFRFEGKAGEEIVAEVVARRLDSQLDSLLKLTDAKCKQLALSDDQEDKAAGLRTHHADSWIRATLPADGTYYLRLTDTQDRGGPEYAYRLRVGPPRPDFELRVEPSGLFSRPGQSAPITIRVIGRDGFNAPVEVALRGTPDGFKLGNVYQSPKEPDLIRFSLFVPSAPLADCAKLVLQGSATIDGRKVVRPCVPADVMEQAFGASLHVVPAQECLAAVREPPAKAPDAPPKPPPQPSTTASNAPPAPPPVSAGWTILSPTPVALPIEGTVQVRFERSYGIPSYPFELQDPVPGITVRIVSRSDKELVLEFVSDPATGSRPGVKGELSVGMFGGGSGRTLRGVLPPIPFAVVVPP
jgi:hypothetical protein